MKGLSVKYEPQHVLVFTFFLKTKKRSIEQKKSFCFNTNNKKDMPCEREAKMVKVEILGFLKIYDRNLK